MSGGNEASAMYGVPSTLHYACPQRRRRDVQPRCASTVPSCQPDGPSAIDTFAADTSAYIKSLDRWVGGRLGSLWAAVALDAVHPLEKWLRRLPAFHLTCPCPLPPAASTWSPLGSTASTRTHRASTKTPSPQLLTTAPTGWPPPVRPPSTLACSTCIQIFTG